MNVDPLTKNLRRQAAWVVSCRIVGIGATLASNILAARLLGPAQFGLFLLVTTVIALGSLLGMAGLNEAALRFIVESLAGEQRGLAKAYVRRSLTIASVASLAAIVLALCGLAIVSWVTGRHDQPWLLATIAAAIALLAWQQLGAELVRAYGDLKAASLFSGGQMGGPISNLLFLAGLGVLALVPVSINAQTATSLLTAALLVTCPLLYLCLSHISRSSAPTVAGDAAVLSHAQGRELLTVGGLLLANQMLAFVTQQLDIWLAGGLLTQEAVGLFGAAKRGLLIAAMPVQMATMTIVASIPRLHAQGRRLDLERLLRGAATVAAIPSLAALAALMLFPDTMLRTVFGGSYSGAAAPLVVLALGHCVLVVSGNPQHVMTMTGRHRTVLAVNFASALVLLLGGLAGGRWFGVVGLAAASAASFAMQNGVLWYLSRRELGIWTHMGYFPWNRKSLLRQPESGVSFSDEPVSSTLLSTTDPVVSSAACPP